MNYTTAHDIKRADLPRQRILLPLKLSAEGERIDAVARVEPSHYEHERVHKESTGFRMDE